MKLLIVEDSESDLDTCRTTIKRYQEEKGREIDSVECTSLAEAKNAINRDFDGAIIDLKLADGGTEGNEIIRNIHDSFRIPVAVMTGTPDNVEADIKYLGVYKKGEARYDEILDNLFLVYDMGLTKIVGGRGIVEQTMDKIFWNNILPQLESWESYAKDGKETEKALLRFTINHLLELLEDESSACYPEEMYINPPVSKDLRTGSIVTKKATGSSFVILSPACDLVIRNNGDFKTDRILLCEIEDTSVIRNKALEGIVKSEKKIRGIEELIKNRHTNYYHWLPKAYTFPGGFINFRKIQTLTKETFEKEFNLPKCQISTHFVKDIVSRFSSYYARQGQPDFEFTSIANQMVTEMEKDDK